MSEVSHDEDPMPNIDKKSCSGIALTPRQLKRLRQRLAEKPLDLDHSDIEKGRQKACNARREISYQSDSAASRQRHLSPARATHHRISHQNCHRPDLADCYPGYRRQTSQIKSQFPSGSATARSSVTNGRGLSCVMRCFLAAKPSPTSPPALKAYPLTFFRVA